MAEVLSRQQKRAEVRKLLKQYDRVAKLGLVTPRETFWSRLKKKVGLK